MRRAELLAVDASANGRIQRPTRRRLHQKVEHARLQSRGLFAHGRVLSRQSVLEFESDDQQIDAGRHAAHRLGVR